MPNFQLLLTFFLSVSATAAGLARQNYGDYKKYNGNAVGAKIAFFDIGNVNSSIPNKGYLTPPQDYYNGKESRTSSTAISLIKSHINNSRVLGLLRVLYRSGARIFSNSWGSSTTNYDIHTAQVDLFMWDYSETLVIYSAVSKPHSSFFHRLIHIISGREIPVV